MVGIVAVARLWLTIGITWFLISFFFLHLFFHTQTTKIAAATNTKRWDVCFHWKLPGSSSDCDPSVPPVMACSSLASTLTNLQRLALYCLLISGARGMAGGGGALWTVAVLHIWECLSDWIPKILWLPPSLFCAPIFVRNKHMISGSLRPTRCLILKKLNLSLSGAEPFPVIVLKMINTVAFLFW